MLFSIFLLIVMAVISSAPGADASPANAIRTNHRRVERDYSEGLIFASESSEEPSNRNEGRVGVSRSSTTLRPALTYRGRAPSRTVPTTPTTTTTERSWFNRLIPTAMPNIFNRVGEFFGKKKTTEATTPLLAARNEGANNESVSSTTPMVDIRVIIDAPEFDCPTGQRRQGNRCRTVI